MNYSAHSFQSLSRLRTGKPGPARQQVATAPETHALRLTGSARISGIAPNAPWYVRLFQRLLKDRLELELIFDVTPDLKTAIVEALSVPDTTPRTD